MPLYRVRNTLQARRIKAFLDLQVGVTRGAVPDPKEEISNLHRSLAEKDRKLKTARGEVQKQRKIAAQQKSEIVQLKQSLNTLSEPTAGATWGSEKARRGALPDLLVIGGQKCGTTFLYELMKQHPYFEAASKKDRTYARTI